MPSKKSLLQKILAFFGLALLSDLDSPDRAIEYQVSEIKRLDRELSKLEIALEEAKKPKEEPKKEVKPKLSYKVGIVEAKRRLRTRKLRMLREALEKVPNNVQGFGGSAIVYQDKEVKIVEFESKAEAMNIVKDAEDGKLAIVF